MAQSNDSPNKAMSLKRTRHDLEKELIYFNCKTVQLVTKFDSGGNTFIQTVPFEVIKEFPILMDQYLQGKNPIITDLSIPREALVDIAELGVVLRSKHKESKRDRKEWLELQACAVGSDTFADLVLIASILHYPFSKEMKSALKGCISTEAYRAARKDRTPVFLPDRDMVDIDQEIRDLIRAIKIPDFRCKILRRNYGLRDY